MGTRQPPAISALDGAWTAVDDEPTLVECAMKDPPSPTLKQARVHDNLTTCSDSLEEDKFAEIGLAEPRSRSPPATMPEPD
jgi:hypothetical protein